MVAVYIITCVIFGITYGTPTHYVEPFVSRYENSEQYSVVSGSSSDLDTNPQMGASQERNSAVGNNQVIYYDEEPMNQALTDIETDNYDDSDNAMPNPVLPLEALPNIFSTYVHEDLPSLEARGGDGIDIFNPENTEYLAPNWRPTRSRSDDFMADLAHETILSNIIPTMSYVRGAEGYSSYQPLRTAVFPGASNSCGIPMLLGCNPNIIRGTLSRPYPEYVPSEPGTPVRGDQAPESKAPFGSTKSAHPFLKQYFSNQ